MFSCIAPNRLSSLIGKTCGLVLLLLTTGLAGGCDRSPSAKEEQTPVATYRVTGGADKSTVWHVGPDGDQSVERVDLPWSREVPATEDAVLFVRANRELDGPSVEVSLTVSGPESNRTNGKDDTSRTVVASDNVTVAGILRSPSEMNRVRYDVENTYRTVDTLRRTIVGSEGQVVDTFTRPDSLAPDEYPSETDRLQPDTTLSIPGMVDPKLILEVSPPTSESIGVLGAVYAWPSGFGEPLLLRYGLLQSREKSLILDAQIWSTAGE
ncbi:hypothetical protein BSZ35_18285 [Salinibacter sp. 10B]|uniref:hypothetical protein n=1 Tax=Salinibacter sp. 10B TaxID=1923971 RepID=UPI000CF44E6D|nr:hypothetical protein [Salinibacter sp. 10B]PQJ26878.1 hypothetical protein BSZ35_18285 [Salinibacter sp. 10B]